MVTAEIVCAATAAAAVAVAHYRQLCLLFWFNKTTATTTIVLGDDLPGASCQRHADAYVKIVKDSIIAVVSVVGVAELVC